MFRARVLMTADSKKEKCASSKHASGFLPVKTRVSGFDENGGTWGKSCSKGIEEITGEINNVRENGYNHKSTTLDKHLTKSLKQIPIHVHPHLQAEFLDSEGVD